MLQMMQQNIGSTTGSTAKQMGIQKWLGVAIAMAFLPTLTGCGSGAVSSPAATPVPVVVVPISVTPSSLDMSPGIPRTFIVAGGTPTYSIVSSNNDLLPISPVTGSTFTLMVAKSVLTDTPVDITIRDSASTAPAALKLTVKPTVFSVFPSGGVTVPGPQGTVVGQDGTCPTSAKVDYYIFGGTPPFSVFSPLPTFAKVAVKEPIKTSNSFTAELMSCGKVAFIVTDMTGRVLETPSIEGLVGEKGTATSAAFSVTPSITVACGQATSVALTGSGRYTATQPTNSVFVTSSGTLPGNASIGTIRGAVSSPIEVSFSDGSKTVSTFVSVTGIVAGACP